MIFDQFQKAITSPRLLQVAMHWASLKPDSIPAWADIAPAAIGPCLGIVWAYTYDASSDAFLGRLAGEHINRLIGRPLKGARVSEHSTDVAVPDFFTRAKRVVTEPALYRGHGLMFDQGDHHCVGERIIMPLASDGSSCDGVLGATDYTCVPRFTVENTPQAFESEQWFSIS